MAAIVPYLCYSDAPAAIDFLCNAFGFDERSRYPMDDGRIGHAELVYEGCAVYLASVWPEMGLSSPQDLPARHCQIYVEVEDVDAHCERARAAGCTISAEPEDSDHGDRMYRAIDPEGNRWMFSQPIADAAGA